jgi:2-polyprenyl-3-methyl-5-hydroxy-6-metoxy-1,4-benzoquinol methylase
MFNKVIQKLIGLEGLEFGGPTELFWNPNCRMPLYQNVKLDGGNLFDDNHFQESFSDFFNYKYGIGQQYNVDCANPKSLDQIDKKYDFIVTSHVIEHIANPIKAMRSWKRLLKDGGFILSIIPNYKNCFDNKRPLTTLLHLIDDFANDTLESDTTHIEEQKQLHDWSYGGHKDFYNLCDNNEKTRVVHHHTFSLVSSELLMYACGLNPVLHFQHDDLNIVNLSQI